MTAARRVFLNVVFMCCHGDGKSSMTEPHSTALLSSSDMRSSCASLSQPTTLSLCRPPLLNAADAGKQSHTSRGKQLCLLLCVIARQEMTSPICFLLDSEAVGSKSWLNSPDLSGKEKGHKSEGGILK